MEQTQPQPILTPQSPVTPVTSHEETMWTSFQTVLAFIALGFFAGSIFSIWSIALNTWVPNKMDSLYQLIGDSIINGSIATLIVAAPVFIGLFYWTNKKYAEQPVLKKSNSKKFLNYITLIITFVILLVQTISAINTALNDAFTANFGLQLLLTFLVCGSIFIYYLYEVRIEKQPASKKIYAMACGGLLILALITLGVSFKVRSELKLRAARNPNPYDTYTTPQKPYAEPTVEPTVQPMNEPAEKFVPETYAPTPVTNGPSIIATSANTPTPMLTVGGINMVVNQVDVTTENGVNELEVTVTFTADKNCTADKATCYTNVGGVQFMDEDTGNRLVGDKWMDRGAMQDRRLLAGEKQTGKEYFQILNPAKQYSVTYNNNKGVYSEKQMILMRDSISKK